MKSNSLTLNTDKLFEYRIRMPKEESSFFYFMLEGHEGLCFYSTLPHENGDLVRDVLCMGSLEFLEEFDELLLELKNRGEVHWTLL